MICLLREAGYERTILRAWRAGEAERALRSLWRGAGAAGARHDRHARANFAGRDRSRAARAIADRWARRFADPLPAFASGWMRVRARARQRQVELPLVISDHADWDELTATFRELHPEEVWITHGEEEALLRWAQLNGITARRCRWWVMAKRL